TYDLDLLNNHKKSIDLSRTFFSPFTKWAGGVYFDEVLLRDSLPDFSQHYAMHNFKSTTQDFWGGYSFSLSNDKSERFRTFNLITALRYQHIKYTENAPLEYDNVGYFSNEKLYLASIAISSTKYAKNKYHYNYDII